ncbi:fimbrial biogenesis chaperone [Serratia marcescens]|uniref:fimbrial biogenesis chaperone n=1 Tax=Serratia marcescens TaxID=615 RepID=UPI003EE1D1C4
MFKKILLLGLALGTAHAYANVVINTTRVIYPERHKDVIVQLINNGGDPSLVQAWIDAGDMNATPETAHVPFLLSPPVVKVAAHGGQQLRIKKIGPQLAADRESVFYLNVLDIPPVPENLQGKNTLQLAVKSRIKLFYRPKTLKMKPEAMADHITLYPHGEKITLKNDAPYHFTLANISRGNQKNLLGDAIMIPPFSSVTTSTLEPVKANERLTLRYVDDLGAYKEKAITSH